MALTASRTWAWPLSMITGMSGLFRWISVRSVIPSMSRITRSVTTMLGRVMSMRCKASAPDGALST